ncbi:thioesterase family protein [Sulfitobacter sp. HNIBRBA3233]|uniref:acyl-CoA thioesterase n=1 Tax=Sulfitobacter marinivivus TaxID=3158558 RepID=UPI0032DF3D2A
MTIPYHTPLSADQQRSLGIETPQPLAMADRVRFSELDTLNHVNNSRYMEWFERMRVRYSQECGISTYGGEGAAPRIVIRSGEIHYRQEMVMDEDYVATCGCTAFRNTSYTLRQEIWSGGTIRCTFDCVLVLLYPDGSGRRMPIPDAVRERFVAVDGATPA